MESRPAPAASIHNQDIDVIIRFLREKQPAQIYYDHYNTRRIASHLELYSHAHQEIFNAEDLHVGADTTGTTYTHEELQRAATSLSFRPLTVNHLAKTMKDSTLHLPYPENQTLIMRYVRGALVGQLQLEPYCANLMRRQRATGLSVEFYSLDGSEGRGIVFCGLSLVTPELKPADERARIL